MPRRAAPLAAHTAGQPLHLSVEDVVELIAHDGLAETIRAVAARIEAEFLRWPVYDKSARVASHSPDGVIELMPVADAAHFAFKYVNGHPRNTTLGLPTVMAFGVLADVATGAPRLLSELTLTTAIRTAAMSALAARHLAREESRTMALIGNGAQAEFQALAMRELLGIRRLRLFDVDPAASAKLLRNLQDEGFEMRVVDSIDEAVQGADVVTTITADKARATILTPARVAPGMHLNAVGGDCPGKTELDPAVLQRASVFVEFEPQTRIEGDLQQMPADFPVTELWRVLAGHAPGRQRADEVTVFDSVGFALEDLAALRHLDERARVLGLGRPISLLPTQPDPKDLHGLLRGGRRRLRRVA